MHATTDRLAFAPPPTPGFLRALVLAIIAHGLLMAALTLGIQWKHEAQPLTAEAELWSSVPVEAAPELKAPEPEPVPVTPLPEPVKAKPTPPAPEPAPPPKPAEVDIALQQEKARLKKQRELELAKLEAQKLEKRKLEKLRQDTLKQEQMKREKALEEQQKLEKLKQAQADKAQKTALEKRKAEKEAAELEAQRVKNLQRMTGMAGATGGANATGSALKSAGPSAGYAGRLRARIKPNIVFTDDISGNPTAEVEVRTAPDGTIISRKLLKSSGVKNWDEAVLKAIDKTEVLPRDTDGRVPALLEISFRPKD